MASGEFGKKAEFTPAAFAQKAVIDLEKKLRDAESISDAEKEIDAIAAGMEITMATHMNYEIAKNLVSGITSSHVGGALGANAANKFSNYKERGTIFEDIIYGGGDANTPFGDIDFDKTLQDIQNKIKNSTNTSEIIGLKETEAEFQNAVNNGYQKHVMDALGLTKGAKTAKGDTIRFGTESKARTMVGRGEHLYNLHSGQFTVAESDSNLTEAEIGNQIIFDALNQLYQKMGTLMLLSYMWKDAPAPDRVIINIQFLDLFHQLSVDKVFIALRKKLITVEGKPRVRFITKNNVTTVKRDTAIDKRAYAVSFDFSKIDDLISNISAELREKLDIRYGGLRTRMIESGLWRAHRQMYPGDGVNDNLFENLVNYLNPTKNNKIWVRNIYKDKY